MANERRVRIVNINKFIKNNGIVNWKTFFFRFFIFYELVLCSFMFLDYYFVSYPKKDLLETFNAVGGDFFILQRYVFLHFIDNTLIADINTFLSDTRGFSIQIAYFHQWIDYGSFELSWFGQFMIDTSIYLTFSLFILVFIQMRYQLRFFSIGLHSIYTPIPLILLSFINDNRHYFKRVSGVKRDTLNKDKKDEIIDSFFSDTELYKLGKSKTMLVIENNSRLWGFYNYYKMYLVKL